MSISVIDRRRYRLVKTALFYLAVSIFCAAFGLVYELFSHGVHSRAMTYFFLVPLAGGALPSLLLAAAEQPIDPPRGVAAYRCGLATLSVGGCVAGILEIYGTASALVPWYGVAGIILVCVGAMRCVNGMRLPSREPD